MPDKTFDTATPPRPQNAPPEHVREILDLFHNAAIGVQWLAADGKILWANRALLALLGYDAREYFGRRAAEFHADPAAVEELLRRLLRNETLNAYEARLRAKDGSIRYVLVESNARFDGERFVHSRCFVLDITERARAARRLAARHAVTRALLAAESLAAAVPAALRALGEELEWEVAAFWQEQPALERLACVDVWGSGVPRDDARGRTSPHGSGLVGRAFQERRPVWADDLRAEPARDQDTRLAELRSGCAVPILRDDAVLGVVELLCRDRRPRDEPLLRDLQDAAAEIAHFADREAAGTQLPRRLAREQQARTEAEAARRRAAFLAEAGQVLASSLAYETTLASVARLAVPYLADWCAVDVIEGDQALRRVAVFHSDPAKVEQARELQRLYPADASAPCGVVHVLRTGCSELHSDAEGPLLREVARDAEQLKRLRELGLRSAMIVPLVAWGRTLGAITLVSGDQGPRFGPADLELAEELARRAALSIENARLYESARAAIEERERAHAELRRREQRFRALVENSSEAIALVDRAGAFVYSGPSTPRALGYSPEELLGRNCLERVHPDDIERARALFQELAREPRGSVTAELRVRSKEGGWRFIEAAGTNLLDEPSVGAIVLNYRDISDRKRAEQRIEHQAFHDALTGLPNRMLFADRLQAAMAHAHRSGRRIAVMFADLDHFKWINDTLGHTAGDRLLKAVADRLCACLREDDTVARLGGDEFIMLLEDLARPEDAMHVASKALSTIGASFEIEGQTLHVTASIGVSVYPDDAQDGEALLKAADNALYRAKEVGRNSVQLSTAAMNQRARARMELTRAMRRALDQGEFLLHYQPQFDTDTRRLVGAEALLRWQHPERGLLLPDEFIPLAEDTRLILPIGEWALRRACHQARSWQADGAPALTMAVNLSARQFEASDLRKSVSGALRESGLDPRVLELEITESLAMRDVSLTRALLADMRSDGVRVAIDDFGTGQSSLTSLKKLPIDALKIDRAFVHGLGHGQDDHAIVRAIIAMAHSLRLRVIAEGVESESQLAFLKRERCEEIQGFLLGRPLPPDEFLKLAIGWGRTPRNGRTLGH